MATEKKNLEIFLIGAVLLLLLPLVFGALFYVRFLEHGLTSAVAVEERHIILRGTAVFLALFIFYTVGAALWFIRRFLLSRDARESQKLDEAKDEFISIASHQLRMAPSAVKWCSEVLLSGDAGKLTAKQREIIGDLDRISKRLIENINALLNAYRVDLHTFMVQPVPVKLDQVAKSVMQELHNEIAEKRLVIKESYGKDVPAIPADPGLIRMVFHHLLANAVRYTPEGGSISVTVRRKRNMIDIIVSDTGYGIPAEEQENIFEKMYRASNVRQASDGTGLGLYVVKTIVEYTKGKIWFESTEGNGTTFFVTLPVVGMKEKSGTSKIV